VEEKKAQTDELIVSIGKEKAVVDEAVEAGREDEEAASKLAEEVLAFQEECSKDLEAGAAAGVANLWWEHSSMLARMGSSNFEQVHRHETLCHPNNNGGAALIFAEWPSLVAKL